MSTDTATDERLTTADYANVLFGEEKADTKQQDDAADKETATQQPQKDKATSKKKPKQQTDSSADTKTGALKAIGTAETWMPRDFASVAPSALVDAVAAHRARYQGIDNFGLKLLYGLYTFAAVPAGFLLNVVSLVAAHAATAINEPSRAREAALGIVFLGIIAAALFWAFGA